MNTWISTWIANAKVHLEWVIWSAGLVLMATMDPYTDSTTLCLFEWMGYPWCPGHGLGHSIAFLARGAWLQSLEAHPLGLLAVPILLHRIVRESYKAFYQTFKLNG